MKTSALLIFLFFMHTASAEAVCVNPEDYAGSVVSIILRKDGFWAQGSAWFYKDSKTLVTAGHLARILPYDPADWGSIEILKQGKNYKLIEKQSAKILRIGDMLEADPKELAYLEKYAKEDWAVLELASPFGEAAPLDIETAPPPHHSPVSLVTYPFDELAFAKGLTLPPENEQMNPFIEKFTSMLYIELLDNKDAGELGSSGAPLLNCQGKAVGIITIGIWDETADSPETKIHRGPGFANNLAVPLQFLKEDQGHKEP